MLETPYFLINQNTIEHLAGELLSALRYRWANGIAGYSFKTDNLPWIIKFMQGAGFWAEVVSADEYRLAKQLGYDPAHIIFNGPVKEKGAFTDAVEHGAVVNIDSGRELDWLCGCDKAALDKANIGLRVNFCLEDYCRGESQCGTEDGRFGFSYERGELKEAISFLRGRGIKLSGLHLHCSSKTRSLNIYRAISNVAKKIVNEYGLDLQYIDVGGGFFGGVEGKPSFDEYFNEIYRVFSADGRLAKVNLIVEPGISVVGAGISYVTEVVDVKQTKNNYFAVLDGSRIHIDPLMKKSSYSYRIVKKDQTAEDAEREQTLCGFTCMENDRFFKITAPPLQAGDRVVFDKVGAYTLCLSPQFISFYPAVAVERGGKTEIVRHKNTAEEFIKSNS